MKTNVISDYDVHVHTGEEYASDAHNFKDQMEKFGGCIDELQQSMERIHLSLIHISEPTRRS